MTQKFIIYFCIAMMSVAQALQAQPIPVRSGLHEGFVRIALDVPVGTDWTLKDGKKSAIVTLLNHNDGFDLARVFSRIDRSVVASLEGTSNQLRIQFNCDCKTSAFSQDGRMIVLDIAAKENEPGEPEAPNNITTLPHATPMAIGGGEHLTFRGRPEPEIPKRTASAETAPPARNRPLQLEESEFEIDATVEIAETGSVSAETLARAQEKLTTSVGAAATRGILRPNRSHIDLPSAVQRPQIDVRIFDSSKHTELQDDLGTAPASGHLNISTSSDVPFPNAGSESATTTMGIQCLDPARVAVSTWGTDQPMIARVSMLRKALYSEFDKLQHDIALDLARTYLHYGFGSEARQVLSLDEEMISANPELFEIANIMEVGRSPGTVFLGSFTDCNSEVALWAILAASNVPASQPINADAALRTLTSLPEFLRSFIAPELSRRLLEYGDSDRAAAALRSLERMAQPLNSAANLAKADLIILEENVGQAQALLADVVASNEQQSAEALIMFVDSHLAADTLIEDNIATLVEAYALEMRDHPVGKELRRTHVLALAKSGQFDEAFEALKQIRGADSDKTKRDLNASLLSLLTKNADDIAFLDHIFSQIESSQSWDDPNINLAVAERLVSLGFGHQAESILMAHPEFSDSQSVRLLRARIALAQNRPFDAEAFSFGINSIDADRLRAEANLRMGNFAQAQAMYLRLGDSQNSEQAIWLSEDWTDLASGETSMFASVARLASTELPDDPSIEGMLARTSASVAESAQARDIISSLLQTQAEQKGSSE